MSGDGTDTDGRSCRECGTELGSYERYCSECGTENQFDGEAGPEPIDEGTDSMGSDSGDAGAASGEPAGQDQPSGQPGNPGQPQGQPGQTEQGQSPGREVYGDSGQSSGTNAPQGQPSQGPQGQQPGNPQGQPPQGGPQHGQPQGQPPQGPQGQPPQGQPQGQPPQGPPQGQPPQGQPQEQKEPVVAAVLSFVITGAGQLYNGQVGKGLALFAFQVVNFILIFLFIGFLLLPIVWIYGIYDAYTQAQKINQRNAGY